MFYKFLSALSLLTRIPVKLQHEPDYSGIAIFFPVIGLLLGIVLFLPASIAGSIIDSPLFTAFAIILVQYLIANLFHLDGLMDTADASGVFGDQEKRYQVLKDSRIGVYGFFAGIMMLSGKFLMLSLLLGKHLLETWAGLMFAMIFGRYSALLIANFGNPVNPQSLAGTLGKPSLIHATISTISCSLVPLIIVMRTGHVLAGSLIFLFSGFGAVLCAGYISFWYAKNIGGYNGDAMGASIELTELVSLAATLAVLQALD